jgi:HEAT repeat protein
MPLKMNIRTATVLIGSMLASVLPISAQDVQIVQPTTEQKRQVDDFMRTLGYPPLALFFLEKTGTDPTTWRASSNIGPVPPSALPQLIKGLESPEWTVRSMSAQMMYWLSPPAAAPAIRALVNALTDPYADVRRRAALTISQTGSVGKQAIPLLIKMLREDTVGYCRNVAAIALGGLGESDRDAINALIDGTNDPDRGVRLFAFDGLQAIGLKTAQAPSQDLLQAIPALIESLSRPDLNDRSNAAGVLGALGPKSGAAFGPLLKMAEHDEHVAPRRTAVYALGKLGIKTPDVFRVLCLAAVAKPPDQDDAELYINAVEAIQRLDPTHKCP